MSDEDDELGERSADLGARAFEQVLGEAVGVSEQNVVCKPVAYILTVSQQDAEGIIPGDEDGGLLKKPTETLNRRERRQTELTSRWQDLGLLSWCENLC